MTIRIIGGEFRNRLLKAPKGDATRPTLAVMRKAVFDILQSKIQDAQFLDLFAGSGLMGLEALSRGAAHVTFVDKDRLALRCIAENVKLLDMQTKTDILPIDALQALKKCAKKATVFDVIYIDPPYKLSQTTQILEEILLFIDGEKLLAPQGILFIEESAPPSLPKEPLQHLQHINARKFSDSILHQYMRIR